MSDVKIDEGQVGIAPKVTSHAFNVVRYYIQPDKSESDYITTGAFEIPTSLNAMTDFALQAAFAAFAEEDRTLANAGIGEYSSLLYLEDRDT